MSSHSHDSARELAVEAAVFDYERALTRLGGDPGLFSEIAALFLEDSPQLLSGPARGFRQEYARSGASGA